jgi:outer membrane protein OmpA-like peptidoglycan-associated protein
MRLTSAASEAGARSRRSSIAAITCFVAVIASGDLAAADPTFDAAPSRPSASPFDLPLVRRARPLRHLAAAFTLVGDFARAAPALPVNSRTTLSIAGAIGVLDWLELGLVLPVVAAQAPARVDREGEGAVKRSAIADMRLTVKTAVPGIAPRDARHGPAIAGAFQLALPTGSAAAFATDRPIAGGLGLLSEYRSRSNVSFALDTGAWLQRAEAYGGATIASRVHLGAGLEIPVLNALGLSAWAAGNLGVVPAAPRNIEREGVLAMRLRSRSGIIASFGAAAGGGAVTAPYRLIVSLSWLPGTAAPRRLLLSRPHPADPDRDGAVGSADRCPDRPGPASNDGCPESDRDGDGVLDRGDACPTLSGPGTRDGCPAARLEGGAIVTTEALTFLTDRPALGDDASRPLAAIAALLAAHPEIFVEVEVHTSSSFASQAYNQALAQRRAEAVVAALVARGVSPQRLSARGVGQRLADGTPHDRSGSRVHFKTDQKR